MAHLITLITVLITAMAAMARRALAPVSVVAVALPLAGCGLTSLTSGIGGGMFGSASKTEVDQVTEEQMLAAAKSDQQNLVASVGKVDAGCPKMDIWPHEGAVTIFEQGRVGDALAVLHRGEITKTARECVVNGSQVTVRYGMSGRVLLGPKGQTGTISLPMNVFLADAKRERLQTDSMRVDVAVAVDKPIGYFSVVRTITFNVPQGSRAGDFALYASFDRKVPGAG